MKLNTERDTWVNPIAVTLTSGCVTFFSVKFEGEVRPVEATGDLADPALAGLTHKSQHSHTQQSLVL